MKILQSIEPYRSLYFTATITPKSVVSGFSIAIGNTGETDGFLTGVIFSGRNGFVFDQKGNFFGVTPSFERHTPPQIHWSHPLSADGFSRLHPTEARTKPVDIA